MFRSVRLPPRRNCYHSRSDKLPAVIISAAATSDERLKSLPLLWGQGALDVCHRCSAFVVEMFLNALTKSTERFAPRVYHGFDLLALRRRQIKFLRQGR